MVNAKKCATLGSPVSYLNWKWCLLRQFHFNPNYRPQRSCEGYVFTGICLSTRGWGCLLQCMLGYHPPEQTPPWSRPPGADPPEQTPPGVDTPLGADTPQEQTPPRSTPPEIRPLLRTVRILLECILVIISIQLLYFKCPNYHINFFLSANNTNHHKM